MKVILRSDVEHVGRAGEIKDVAPGFGRNFLFPKRLAVPATEGNMRWWEKGRDRLQKLSDKRLGEDKALAEKLGAVALSFARQAGEEGKLFGSVGKSDVLKSLAASGYKLDKTQIVLESAIKQTGDHEVEVRLSPGVSTRIKVSVVPRQ